MYLITMFIKNLKTSKNKTERLTHATSKLGKGVEQKQSDYQPKIGKTEKNNLLTPNLRVARERYHSASSQRTKSTSTCHFIILSVRSIHFETITPSISAFE